MRLRLRTALLLFCAAFLGVHSAVTPADFRCLNDGFANPVTQTCDCLPYFSGPFCGTIECLNGGHPDDDGVRCLCPPGFLGTHCEPVKCIGGEIGSFEIDARRRDLAIIITYNGAFKRQLKKTGDNLINSAICDGLKAVEQDAVTIHIPAIGENVVYLDECQDTLNGLLGTFCPEDTDCDSPVTTELILEQLKSMRQDSRLLILSNTGLADYNETTNIEKIKKIANAMRLQIHSLVLAPEAPHDNTVYGQAEYAKLEELAESTLGFFITPFDASGGQKLGTSDMGQTVQTLFPIFFHGSVFGQGIYPSAEGFLTFVISTTEQFYVAVRSTKTRITEFTTSFVTLTPNATTDTGYWHLYAFNPTTEKDITFSIFIDSDYGDVNAVVHVLGKADRQPHLAATTHDSVDASTPFALEANAQNILVGYLPADFPEENLYVEVSNTAAFSLTAEPPKRRDCQYNTRVGSVSCSASESTYVTLRDSSNGHYLAVLPFYCSSTGEAEERIRFERAAESEPLRTDGECPAVPAPAFIEGPGNRALIFGLHKTQDNMNLVVAGGDSLARTFKRLRWLDPPFFTTFTSNFYDATAPLATIARTDFNDFLKDIMDERFEVVENEPTCGASVGVEDTTTINDMAKEILKIGGSNSYALFVADHAYNLTDNEHTVLQRFYNTRNILIIAIVGCPDVFDAPQKTQDWHSLASRTGGFAIPLSDNLELKAFVNEFFANPTIGIYDSAIVSAMDVDMYFDDLSSTSFIQQNGSAYRVVAYAFPSADHLELNGTTIQATIRYGIMGSFAIFDLPASTVNTLQTVKLVRSDEYFLFASIRVFEIHPTQHSTVAFASSAVSDAPAAYPVYNPSGKQLQVVNVPVNAENVEVSIIGPGGAIVNVVNATKRGDGCNNFQFGTDYSWSCNDPTSLFYVTTTTTLDDGSSFTRSKSFICWTENGPRPTDVPDPSASTGLPTNLCLNGGTPISFTECVCPVHWSGSVCQTPVCLNGGSPNSASQCDCLPNYNGNFCENFTPQCNQTTSPALRSLATTVIFVVEESSDVIFSLQNIKEDAEWKAAQYIVVSYGVNSSGSAVYTPRTSTTNPAHAIEVLRGIYMPPPPVATSTTAAPSTTTPAPTPSLDQLDAAAALRKAISMQVTPSSLLFWFSTGGGALNSTQLLSDIAVKRVSLRAAVRNPPSATEAQTITLSGGSLFLSSSATSDTDYFAQYLGTMLTPPLPLGYEKRLNQLYVSSQCNDNHTFAVDGTTTQIFITATGPQTLTLKNSAGDVPLKKKIPDVEGSSYVIYSYTIDAQAGADQYAVTSPINPTEEPCSYYIEAISNGQAAFGFTTSEGSTDVLAAPPNGANYLVTYFTGEMDNEVTATVFAIGLDGSYQQAQEWPLTLRQDCTFRHSLPFNCTDDVLAYSITLHNTIKYPQSPSASKVDKQFNAYCLRDADCLNGGQAVAGGGCKCPDNFEGVLCELPKCQNNATRDGEACNCPPGFIGQFCELIPVPVTRTTTELATTASPTTPSNQQVILFLQDVCGNDTQLKATTNKVLDTYGSLTDFDFTSTIAILGANSDDVDPQVVQSYASLSQLITSNTAATCGVTSSKKALAKLYSTAKALPSHPRQVFAVHVTQTGIKEIDSATVKELQNEFGFQMQSVGMTQKNIIFNKDDEVTLESLGNFNQTYDWCKALKILYDFKNTAKPLPTCPDPRQPSCVNKLQSTFLIAADISNITDGQAWKSKIELILKSFVKDFNMFTGQVIPTIPACDYDAKVFDNQTNFWGSLYYDGSVMNQPLFCSPNIVGFPGTVYTERNQGAQVNMASILAVYKKFLTKKTHCLCVREDDDKTTKFVLWIPLSKTSLDQDPTTLSIPDFFPPYYKHIVLPFGFDIGDNDLWGSLLKNLNSTSKATVIRGDTSSVAEIVQDLWTQVCRLSGIIEPNWTAEPLSEEEVEQEIERIQMARMLAEAEVAEQNSFLSMLDQARGFFGL